jgi:methylmalonyl-CoA mutase, N-terminal domain
MSELKKAHERWSKNTYLKATDKGPERKKSFLTSSGILRHPVDVASENFTERVLEKLGFPGEFPFTRGVQPTMYRGRHWTMRQYAGFGAAKESNQRYHALLKAGQTGLSVAFDLPTQMGFDADSPRALGEVGKVGVSISSVRDMQVLMDNIPLGQVSTSMTINATAPILLSLYAAVAEKQNVPMQQLQGTVQNDILKEYIARGTYIYPPGPSLRLITNLFAFCAKNIPKWNPISISGYHIREAGSTAAQEIGFTLADGIAYVDAALKAGLAVDDFAPRLSFFFNVHNDFFEEVAKFRAARRLWADIMKNRFHAKDARSMMLRFHAQTAGSTLTAQQPMNNVVRVAIQGLAAVLGGAQSLHTNGWDEALALPSESAAKLALRTQQVIAHETGVADTIDGLGGSFHVEYLTDELETKAKQYIARIDDLGGMVRAIEQGFPQQEIQSAAYTTQRELEMNDTKVVGVNAFTEKEKPIEGLLKIDESVGVTQVELLKQLKASRSQANVTRALDSLQKHSQSERENLMPLILDAVKTEATLGEISDAMRSVFGQHQENVVL